MCDSSVTEVANRHRCHSFDALESIHRASRPNGMSVGHKIGSQSGVEHPNPQSYQALILVCHNLRQELWACRKQLKAKTEECDKIGLLKDQMQKELQDLTASLFEEANKMVQDANVERATSEKRLVESQNKVDMLEAEVNALKTLVITSTPKAPNRSLHTHIMPSSGQTGPCQHCHHSTIITRPLDSPSIKGHKRSTSAVEVFKKSFTYQSHRQLPPARFVCGKSSSLPLGTAPPKITTIPLLESPPGSSAGTSVCCERSASVCSSTCDCIAPTHPYQRSCEGVNQHYEIDPIYFGEFVAWHKEPSIGFNQNRGESKIENPDSNEAAKFVERLYGQDILPTLEFTNKELSASVLQSLEENKLVIEALYDKGSTAPRECSLTRTTKICPYRLKLNEQDQWHFIGESTRNRIASVGDALSYLRYIEKGIVKSEINEMYWEVMKLKKQMALSRYTCLE